MGLKKRKFLKKPIINKEGQQTPNKINFGVLNGSAAFVFTYTVTPATPIIKNQTEFDLL